MEKGKTPPIFGGVCHIDDAFKVGMTIDKNVSILKRFLYLKTRLYDTAVKHMNSTPEWEVKGGLSYHLWLDAEHISWMRKRVSEMREPPHGFEKIPDDRLASLMNECIYARSTIELLSGIYRVIRPALLKAYKEHLVLTNPLVDQPTCRMLKVMIMEEEEILAWGEQAITALLQTDEQRNECESWVQHLNSYVIHAQGAMGFDPITGNQPSSQRAVDPFQADFTPRRDERFTDLFNSVLSADEIYLDRTRHAKERVWALLYKRLREMDVPEMQCSIVAETPDQPWEYYHDMARQIWDEARHSMMGQASFVQHDIDWTKLPIRINFSYELNRMLTPEERHAILYQIEFGLMPGGTGKKYEWETAMESGYQLATTFHDHDWADEVLHAQIGKKWIVKRLGGVKQTIELAEQAWRKLEQIRPQYVNENPDWWEHFYREVKELEFK